MSYIDNTRRNIGSPFEQTVCLTQEECKILLPFFQRTHKELQAKYEKYMDIQEGGEATVCRPSFKREHHQAIQGRKHAAPQNGRDAECKCKDDISKIG